MVTADCSVFIKFKEIQRREREMMDPLSCLIRGRRIMERESSLENWRRKI